MPKPFILHVELVRKRNSGQVFTLILQTNNAELPKSDVMRAYGIGKSCLSLSKSACDNA